MKKPPKSFEERVEAVCLRLGMKPPARLGDFDTDLFAKLGFRLLFEQPEFKRRGRPGGARQAIDRLAVLYADQVAAAAGIDFGVALQQVVKLLVEAGRLANGERTTNAKRLRRAKRDLDQERAIKALCDDVQAQVARLAQRKRPGQNSVN